MSNITLYQCAAEVRQALDDLADTQEQWAQDTIEAVIGQFENKAAAVAAYALNLEAQENLLAEHIKTMQAKLKAAKNRKENLKAYLAHHMQAAGITEIKAQDGTFQASFRKSEAVEVYDEAQIPDEFMREKITFEVNKTAIKEAVKTGREVPGAKLEVRQNLQIK